MSSFDYPSEGGGSSGIPKYASFATLPTSATNGDTAVTLDTDTIYIYNGSAWVAASGPGAPITVTDTNSIDLTLAANSIYADLRLSAAVAGTGFTNAVKSIQSDGLQVKMASGDLTGTNVTVTGGTAALLGSGTVVSIPQSVATTATPTFAGATLSGLSTGVVHAGAGGALSSSLIVNADVSATAAIAATKIGTGAVDNTEFSYLDGVTSAIQTQLNSKEVPITFSTGLTRTTNTVTVNTSQNISTLSNLTTNGFVKTAGGTGALSVDTSTYLTGNQSITVTGAVTGSGTTSIATTLATNGTANSNLAQVATQTFKGRTTAGTGNVEDLTATQATAILNTMVGDAGSGGTKGLVPAPATGDATKFLTGAATYVSGQRLPTIVTITNASSPYTAAWNSTIYADASAGAITINYPTAVGNAGSTITVKKTDATFNAVTVDPFSTQLIDSALTSPLNTQNESLMTSSDGTNVTILSRTYPQVWIAYTPTFTGFGTVTGIDITYRREGANCQIQGNFTVGTTTATEARLSLPSGLTSSTTQNLVLQIIGYGGVTGSGTTTNFGSKAVLIEPSVTYVTWGIHTSTSAGITKQQGSAVIGSGTISFFASVPIAGWV